MPGSRLFLDTIERRIQRNLAANYYDLDHETRLRARGKALGVLSHLDQRRLVAIAQDKTQPALGERACELLILTNAGFVEDFIRAHASRGLEAEVLRQECREAVYRAIQTYSPNRGANFLSHARWQMRAAISTSIRNDSRLIRLKSRAAEIADRVQRAIKDFAQEGVELNQLTAEILAERTGDRPERVKDVLPYLIQPLLRLDAPVETGDGQMQGGGLACEVDFLEELTIDEEHQRLAAALATLPPFAQRLLELYHGLGTVESSTQHLYDGVYVAKDGSEYSAEQTVIAARRSSGGSPVLALKQRLLNLGLKDGTFEYRPESEEAADLYRLSGVPMTSAILKDSLAEAERLLRFALDPERAAEIDRLPAPPRRTITARPARTKQPATPALKVRVADILRAGLLDEGERLSLLYKGQEYGAFLLADGSLRLDEREERIFTALSSAAEAAKGIPADPGWNSWSVERNGARVTLFDLRERYRALNRSSQELQSL